MPTLTLPSSPKPDDEPEMTSEIKLYKAEFGGYTQRIGQGVNNVRRSITLNWTNILESEATTLETFCNQHTAGQAFYWTPNGMSLMKWSLVRFRRKIRGAGFSGFTMEIQQEFDP